MENRRKIIVGTEDKRVSLPFSPQTKDELLAVASVLYVVTDCVGDELKPTNVAWPCNSEVPVIIFTRVDPADEPKPIVKAKPNNNPLRRARKVRPKQTTAAPKTRRRKTQKPR